LKRRAGADWIVVEVDGDARALADRMAGAPWLRTADPSGSSLRLAVLDLAQAQRAIPEAVAGLGLGLRRFELAEASLEEVFVELVGGTKS
jgi:ABC-2 type transport system ATP-binding protein